MSADCWYFISRCICHFGSNLISSFYTVLLTHKTSMSLYATKINGTYVFLSKYVYGYVFALCLLQHKPLCISSLMPVYTILLYLSINACLCTLSACWCYQLSWVNSVDLHWAASNCDPVTYWPADPVIWPSNMVSRTFQYPRDSGTQHCGCLVADTKTTQQRLSC